MFFANYVVVDITNSDIRFVAVKRGKINKWATAPLPEGVVKAGIIREPQAMGVIMDNLFKSLRLKRNHVICTVTGLPFIYRTVSMPGVERIPVEAIERESRREMSLTEEDMYLSWQVTETHQNTKEVDYFVLGVPRNSLNPLVEALSQARIKSYMIDIKPLALARAASLKDALIVSLEKDYIDVVVVADGLVRVIHSFNPGDKSADTIGLVNDITDGLNKAIKSFERDFPKNTLPVETPILFSGTFSSDDPLLLLVQEATGHSVLMVTSSLNAPASMPIGMYAALLGLISKKISPNHHPSAYHDINLNLLSGLKKQHAGKFQTAYVLATVFTLALAALVYETYDLKTTAAAEVASLQQTADLVSQKLTALQNANRQALADRQALSDKSQIVRGQQALISKNKAMIDSQKLDFASRIGLIYDQVPIDAEIVTIDVQSKTIKVTGTAQNGFDVLTMTDNLEKSSYFSGARVEKLAPAKEVGVAFQLAISNRINE